MGQFKGTSANVISLGAYNVPQGSVVVTAGGVTLTEGSDYSVDYNAGEVTILNQSIINAGTTTATQGTVSLGRQSFFVKETSQNPWCKLLILQQESTCISGRKG